MRKRQGFLAVLALLFIVILGGCGGGDTTLSDLERTAEQFKAAPADTRETYTFSTGGAVRFSDMMAVEGQKTGRAIYDDCLRITMACELSQARAFFDQAEVTAVSEDGRYYSDSTFFVNGDEKECALTIECPTGENVKYIAIGPFKPNFDGDKTKIIFERTNAGT